MDTYILIDEQNKVVNFIDWDGDTNNWQPPAGLTAIKYSGTWGPGWDWNGTQAVDPNPPPPPPPKPNTPGPTVI